METIDSTIFEIAGLKEFTEWVESFCALNGIVEYQNTEDYSVILNLPPEDILSLTADECLTNSITLLNYAGFLQKQLDMLNRQHSWCIEALNFLFSKQWSSYDKFLPADIKKQSIIAENSYAQSVEFARLRISAGIKMLSDTCKDVKKRVTLFQDLGKSRRFK